MVAPALPILTERSVSTLFLVSNVPPSMSTLPNFHLYCSLESSAKTSPNFSACLPNCLSSEIANTPPLITVLPMTATSLPSASFVVLIL